MFALTGILMALRQRDASGQGQHVDVSMFDSMISAMASNYAQYLGAGTVPGPLGTAFATIVPYACFPTADRLIAIAVASESLWERFCQALAQPDWLADPRLATNALRVANRDWFEPALTAILEREPSAHWLARLERAGIPCSAVNTLADVAAHPQAAHRGMFPTVHHPTAGPARVTGLPIKLGETDLPPRTPAPLPGEHTVESLRELLALSDEEIANLEQTGVIRGPRDSRVD
jgi:crotonobetainyl-CoA:carnitine CoA-transferase CaiB-like acyl-CoA transferase